MTPQDFITQWGAQGGIPGSGYTLNEEQGAQSHFLQNRGQTPISQPTAWPTS